jgi:hypothetical protein
VNYLPLDVKKVALNYLPNEDVFSISHVNHEFKNLVNKEFFYEYQNQKFKLYCNNEKKADSSNFELYHEIYNLQSQILGCDSELMDPNELLIQLKNKSLSLNNRVIKYLGNSSFDFLLSNFSFYSESKKNLNLENNLLQTQFNHLLELHDQYKIQCQRKDGIYNSMNNISYEIMKRAYSELFHDKNNFPFIDQTEERSKSSGYVFFDLKNENLDTKVMRLFYVKEEHFVIKSSENPKAKPYIIRETDLFTIPRAGRFLNFWRRDFMSQYIAEIAANLDKFARSSNELGRKRCR